MKTYKSLISLSKNERGIWDLDTIKGCKSGMLETEGGCYGDCYAYKTAKRYGIDFTKSIERHFEDEAHRKYIVNQIEKIDMDFIRIGCSGDPSENWNHTINIIESLKTEKQLSLFPVQSKKQIVIITRHWNTLTDLQAQVLTKYNICVNTSVSAMDSKSVREHCISQYNRLKSYSKSILRVVTADFNQNNVLGLSMSEIQRKLLKNENVIDTVFRPSSKNKYVVDGIINVRKMAFMKSKALVSKYNKKTFLGKCENCLEMCGVNM
jgi:hypothetical protein